MRPSRTLLLGCLIAALAVVAIPTAGAQTAAPVVCEEPTEEVPDTQDELLAELRALEDSPGLSSYSEFELIRSQAALDVQTGTFDEADRERNAGVVRTLRAFERAYDCRDRSEFDAALAAANETASLAAGLGGEAGGQYQAVADIGLVRFYEDTGGELLAVGEQRESTPERIATFESAATAFRAAGAVDRFSQLSARLERIEREFEADMDRVNASLADADGFVESCTDCGSVPAAIETHGIGVFSLYADALSAGSEIERAEGLLEQHGVDDASIDSADAAVAERTTMLAVSSVTLLVAGGTAVAVVAAVVTSRLVAWKRDVEAATAGDVLLLGRLFDA